MYNKTLITITCVIAIFFFGKWILEVRPRWELKKDIIEVKDIAMYNLLTNEEYYNAKYCSKSHDKEIIEPYTLDSMDIKTREITNKIVTSTEPYVYCYTEESIKVN